MAIHEYQRLTQDELQRLDLSQALLFLPFGAPERHGPHLPLSTDALISRGLAQRSAALLAEMRPELTILLHPTLHIGAATIRGTGSLKINGRTLRRLLVQTGRRLAATGITRLVLLTGHGGLAHVIAIESAMRELRKRGLRVIAPTSRPAARSYLGQYLDRWEQIIGKPLDASLAAHLDCDLHAGLLETGLLLELAPDQVRPEYRELPPIFPRERPWLRRLIDLSLLPARLVVRDPADRERLPGAALIVYRDLCWVLDGRERGYVGDPAAADKRFGAALVQTVSEDIAEAVLDVCVQGGDPRAYSSGYEYLMPLAALLAAIPAVALLIAALVSTLVGRV
ncbi:MAG: creatininase family protein [Candidatus Alcyoniella australis]|nr:creatininase family protein [Candidatus Alcyoniella australis]